MSSHISTPMGAIKTKWDFSNFPNSNSIYENVNEREIKGCFTTFHFTYAFNLYCILLMADGGDQLVRVYWCIAYSGRASAAMKLNMSMHNKKI